MKGNAKTLVAVHMAAVICALVVVGWHVVHIDPFFHYHKPYTEIYFYRLNNERSQNDGITKNFEYDALITGTSMTENFKTSELDEIFGVSSVKVPFSGGSYKEINDNLVTALDYHPDLKMIVRGLDMYSFFDEADRMREDLGSYPTYLYDKNIWNDVQYIFNRDVIFNRVYPMESVRQKEGFVPGVASFDQYSYWMTAYHFGIGTACPEGVSMQEAEEAVHLTEEEKERIHENIDQNVTSLARNYPNVDFYYFFTPYSILWWQALVTDGNIYRQIEAEQLVIEDILACNNIKLYSFNNRTDITTDLNNYRDTIHYGSWINSLMLRWMRDGKYQLTKENYKEYLEQELSFYTTFDYGQLNGQEDYVNDYYAEALLNKEINGTEPLKFSEEMLWEGELNSADVVEDQYDGAAGIECHGTVQRISQENPSIADYLISVEYVGCKLEIEDIGVYRYLVFYGRKNRDHGQPSVCMYNEDNEVLASCAADYHDLDNEWHQYLIDVSQLQGKVTIIFNGGYVDSTGSADSSYTFSNITLY